VTTADAIVFIVVGGSFVVYAFTGKQSYALKGRFSQGRPIPRWLGCLLCAVIGALFILFGVSGLVKGP
jgi:hypothetical protein